LAEASGQSLITELRKHARSLHLCTFALSSFCASAARTRASPSIVASSVTSSPGASLERQQLQHFVQRDREALLLIEIKYSVP